ncbi:hypothetical protein QJS10_CPB12g00100 [Acorus calamus]|uniref:Uncharacterized protein n=1 Tax=Acorus calamus TaxID=4465 RepID=A0AAV9DMA2_ACOCL|nr:hypothetical protein QJS10_CPB12g00100 [Acorus calamus]
MAVSIIGSSSSSSSSSMSAAAMRIRSFSHGKNLKSGIPWTMLESHGCKLQKMTIVKEVRSCLLLHGTLKANIMKKKQCLFATSEDQPTSEDPVLDSSEKEKMQFVDEDDSMNGSSHTRMERAEGKIGYISFYGFSYQKRNEIHVPAPKKGPSNLFWFIGPSILVASLVLPSLYLRRIFSTVLEDSLLTDFVILFFTEALFYCGVAVFVFLIDHEWRPLRLAPPKRDNGLLKSPFWHRVSSVAILVLSLIIPLVTMGMVWPWTGPAASATLAPYLVGLVVQFAFEQYSKYQKSPAWPVIPVIFQVYRLHQLNRAAQLVTALSYSVRGVEMTPQTLAINNSLGTLLNVLQLLGVICIWSLASFLMRSFHSSPALPDT